MKQETSTLGKYVMMTVECIRQRSKVKLTEPSLIAKSGVAERTLRDWQNNLVHRPQNSKARSVLTSAFGLADIKVTYKQISTLLYHLKHVADQSVEMQERYRVELLLERILDANDDSLDNIRPPFDGLEHETLSPARQLKKSQAFLLVAPYRLITGVLVGTVFLFVIGFVFLISNDPTSNRNMEIIIADAEVAQELEALWEQGFEASFSGDNVAYATTMAQAVTLASDQFGTDSLHYAQAQNHMIGAFGSVNRLADAAQSAQEAIRVYSLHPGYELDIALNKVNLAGKLIALNLLEQAEREILEALEIYEGLPASRRRTLSLAGAYEGHSQILRARADFGQALERAYEAVRLYENEGITDSVNYGWALANVAWIEKNVGNCPSAQALFTKAVEAFDAAGAAEDFHDRATAAREANREC